jgi:hypothetical protein
MTILRRLGFPMVLLSLTAVVCGAQNLMPGVENSVGYIASGTSIQPRTASESSAMIHVGVGNWTAIIHGNAFLAGIQQNKSRGRDKVFSANWVMPMMHRQADKRNKRGR